MSPRALLATLAVILCAGTAQAQTLFSKTFYAAGTCNGQDVVTPDHMWTPWEAAPITIVGMQVELRPNSPLAPGSYFFAGNSFSPDVMGWGELLANGKGLLDVWYPAGTGFPFPASGLTTPPHVDLHVGCYPSGIGWQAFYTVFYTLP